MHHIMRAAPIVAITFVCFAQQSGVAPAQSPAADATKAKAAEDKAKRNAQIFENNATAPVLYDRNGKRIGSAGERALYEGLVLSPDKSRLAEVKVDIQKECIDIFVRDLATGSETKFTNSATREFALGPVWSPDGRRLAYTAMPGGEEGIYIRSADGKGAEQLVYKNPGAFLDLSDWSLDGRMLAFAKSDLKGGNLYILSVEGSGDHKPTEIFRTELQVSAPRFSPDGKYLSYSVTDKANKSEIYVRAVDAAQTGGPWKISDGSSGPAFWRADGKELAYTGPDRSVMVATVATTPSFTFTKPKPLFRPAGAVPDRIAWISRDAERFVALPQPRTQSLNQITIFDRQGKPVQTVGEPGMYSQPAFSPDGKQLSVVRNDLNTGHEDIWTIDVASGKRTRITDDAFSRAGPQWSRDGKHILYASGRNGDWGIYRRAADGSGKEELLFQYTPGAFLGYNDISPDGKYVIAESGGVILAVPLTGKDALARQAVEYLREEFSDGVGRLSPDGGLMAYRSDELQAERGEIFVRPFNSDGTSGSQKWQVSKTGAAAMVHWRADGKELFYRRLDLETNDLTVMAVDVATTPQFKCGAPKALFKLPGPIQGNLGNVSPDGQRFVFAVNVPETTASASGTAATAR